MAVRRHPARQGRLTARRRSTRSARRDEQRKVSVTEPKQGQRLQADARLQPAEGRRRGAGAGDRRTPSTRRARRRVRGDGRPRRRDPGDGLQPSFDASVFAKPISQKTYDFLTSNATDAPLLNRATESAYPTGSTFKPITALGGAREGPDHARRARSTTRATGSTAAAEVPERQEARASAPIDMSDALKVSSDIFFFKLGARANDQQSRAIQTLGDASSASGARPGSTCRARPPGLVPDRQVARRRRSRST